MWCRGQEYLKSCLSNVTFMQSWNGDFIPNAANLAPESKYWAIMTWWSLGGTGWGMANPM